MNVSILQQYLENLILPLEASAAPTQSIDGLKRACQGLQPFRDKAVGEFAEFLARAAGYERDGKWPSSNPPIVGRIVDEPSTTEYAQRLRAFLEREVPSGGPISDHVRAELDRLTKRLKPEQVKEMARELQIEESFRGAKQGIEKIVLRLTGQKVRGKKSPSSRSRAAKTDPAVIQQYATELRNLASSGGLEQRLDELVKKLSAADLQALVSALGATEKSRAKATLRGAILSALKAPPTGDLSVIPGDNKIARLTEIVAALKVKADGPGAPYDEIEAELRSLEGQMDRDEAIAVAKRIGIVRNLNSRTDAVEEIRRKVFEMKRARESIAY
jgi:hypothetical protein